MILSHDRKVTKYEMPNLAFDYEVKYKGKKMSLYEYLNSKEEESSFGYLN